MNLARFPRTRLAHMPTPLEPMERLTCELAGPGGKGPKLWIKRDDCTGLSSGGNKTRKLEYLIADALAQGADTIITQGATQSNHARQTAAAAAKMGLECHLLLEDRTGRRDQPYTQSGNVLLNRLHGATMAHRPAGTDMQAEMEKLAEELKAKGRKPYVIPGGGSNPVGALGYAHAALEMVNQAAEIGLRIDHVVHATGSAGTQAGLVAGLVALNTGIPVLGICVNAPQGPQQEKVLALTRRTLAHLGLSEDLVTADHVKANDRYVGQGYGIATEGMIEAVRMVAELEGILLDPVYSGKGMAGLIDLVRKGEFADGANIVFIHTGGSVGLFGYPETLEG